MTLQEMLRVFEKHGVKAVESVGQPFDPALHEAMMQEQTDEQPENTVVREMQKGYLINDRLLRPAMVVVSKSSSDADANESQSGE
jgi:molecular chaperone GrpE